MAKGYYLTESDAQAVKRLIAIHRRGIETGGGRTARRDALSRYGPLFRVTAVDTEAGTCTVQRPYDLESLAEGTEITGVLYDPDNEPAVDDLGVLMRLANGALFFFAGGRASLMLIAKEDMTADDTEYLCKALGADGSEGEDVYCRRPNGIDVSTGDVGFLGQDSSGQNVFHPAQSAPVQNLMIIAKEDMTADNTGYVCRLLETDGTEGTEISCCRPNGIYISGGTVGFLGQDSDGHNVFQPANMREEANMPLVAEVRTSDPASPVVGQIWYRSDL